ncbi:methyltransferase domain-containing protein [Streptomyces venezuelae]|uniref:HemK2/MTQ2 family protein methyltransferase n=1 Tax=Streptomyces venezuelae TaxID=54571 RepID=UPI0012391E68|nr:HemK2/MTQ2 family protein methyltransferase [Streptomyces venezuelae]QES10212.1 methyltransferase domain-containing protein [Streptomyces venezuelae]
MASSTTLALGTLPGKLIALPGVYSPQADTRLLAEALSREELDATTDVLDIGTGTGALALCAARTGARVVAVDVSWRAVIAAKLNAIRQGQRLRVLHGDFSTRVQGRRFDLILTNPPYVPSARSRPPSHGAARAWDAGPDGRAVIDRVCARAPALLRPGGVLLMVHSAMSCPETTVDRLRTAGLTARITGRTSVPWGPVLRGRRSWLQGRGLADEGVEHEELVIIRAEHL